MNFHPNIGPLILGRGIRFLCGENGIGITLYSGLQPTAQQILDNWVNYNSSNSNFLVHFIDNRWDQPNHGNLLTLYNMTESTPINSGIATWAIHYAGNRLLAQLNGADPDPNFLVLPVTNTAGKGIIRLADTNIVAGTPLSITAGSLSTTLS
jgi:hypothetical protein